jgi:thiosulfate/3-mercaptopyruvate sulfurtransferase
MEDTMKNHLFCFIIFIIAFTVPVAAHTNNTIDPLVSIDWLQKNIDNPSVVILDIRKVEEYKEGHIPGSVSLTYTAWRTMEKNLDCQLPPKDDLNDTLCSAGLHKYAAVVIVGKKDTDKDRVNMTRVAWTLKYAGIKRLAILDGGYNNWLTAKLPVSTGWQKTEKSRQKCRWNEGIIATKEQVLKGMNKATIIDTRLAQFFSGKETQPTVKRKGHIPGALNLPYSLVFKKDGEFEDKAALQAHAYRAIGDNKDREVIVLCCNGQFASSWWFVLSEMLGYKKVAIYDGSMEEWCRDEKAPLIESTEDK